MSWFQADLHVQTARSLRSTTQRSASPRLGLCTEVILLQCAAAMILMMAMMVIELETLRVLEEAGSLSWS